jgi:hypothetical protein
MLKQFNSNNRKITKPVPKNIKGNTLDNDAYIAYLESIAEAEFAEHNTNVEKISSKSRKNTNQKQILNNSTKISNFHNEILKYSAKVKRVVADELEVVYSDSSNSTLHKLIIYNKFLDYGTEAPTPENFEVLENGLHIPGFFDIKQVGNNIEVTFTSIYLLNTNSPASQFSIVGRIL